MAPMPDPRNFNLGSRIPPAPMPDPGTFNLRSSAPMAPMPNIAQGLISGSEAAKKKAAREIFGEQSAKPIQFPPANIRQPWGPKAGGTWPAADVTRQMWEWMRTYGPGAALNVPKEYQADYQQWAPYTPWEPGIPITPEFQKLVPGIGPQTRGEDPWAPFDFNMGPRMASVPLGEGAGVNAPWGGWQPAQEEGFDETWS